MKTLVRAATILTLAFGGVAALAGPAEAATITVAPGPFPVDGVISISGSGCPATAPVSLDVWDTSKPGSHVTLDSATTTSPSGAFTYPFDLDNRFDAGAQIGIYFTCTAALDWSLDGNAGSALWAKAFRWLEAPGASTADIIAPSTATYGLARDVTLVTDAVLGNAVVTLDGAPLEVQPGSVYGSWRYRLPDTLAVGTHTLGASWTPTAPGSSTATDTASVRITKLTPRLALGVSDNTVRRGQGFTARVRLTGTRIAPRTGVVVIKDGARAIRRFSLRAGDAGTRAVLLRLDRTGARNLTATYLGNAFLTPKRSPVVTVRVRR